MKLATLLLSVSALAAERIEVHAGEMRAICIGPAACADQKTGIIQAIARSEGVRVFLFRVHYTLPNGEQRTKEAAGIVNESGWATAFLEIGIGSRYERTVVEAQATTQTAERASEQP